jgi:hypothetical protein
MKIQYIFFFIFTQYAFGQTILEKGESSFFRIQKVQTGNSIEVLVTDLKGVKLSEERIFMEQGQFKDYAWTQYQTGEKVNIELRQNKIIFNSKGKKKIIDLSNEELKFLTLPPLLSSTLIERIKKNPNEEKFEVVVIVPDRMLLLRFKFIKTSEKDEVSEWLLKPNNFFIGLLVGPVIFQFDKNYNLKKIKNITLPIRPTTKTEINF